jgi:predicted transcriptional regulator YdeE
LEALTLPGQTYMKFTSNPGKMPHVVIQMWQKIWTMSPSEMGGQRAYRADFEVYDERSQDPNHASLDLYIGIKE